MEIFEYAYPAVLLSPFIKQYWSMQINSGEQISERVIPTGNIQLVFHRGDLLRSITQRSFQPRAFLSGQSTHFHDVVSSGVLQMLVVVFHPYGARPFFKLPMEKAFENDIPLEDLQDKGLKELEDRVLNAPNNQLAIYYIESFFLKRLHYFEDYNYKRVFNSIRNANKDISINIATLADISYLSKKQFSRVFLDYVGIHPKKFLRVLRFQKALYHLQSNPEMSLTELTYAGGFYDQSHLIREFKAFSGYTPTEYLALCAPYSDYFSE